MDRQSCVVRPMRLLTVMLGLLPLLWAPVSQAQTTSITSSGLNTVVTLSQPGPPIPPTYNITGGTRPGNGPNLFHSFGEFSVGTHDRALFLNDSGLPTTNILSRVTGGHPSNIFGNITTTSFQGANLYLINPAGVLFGPTASLNVSGSVTVSTADYLRLADGLRFNAVPGPQDALLSQAPVVAFGFLNPHPRPISVQGATLEVQQHTPNETARALTLVGGDITLTGGALKAEAGIELVSVASRGEVRAAHLGSAGADLREPLPIGVSLGTIRMSNTLLETTEPKTNIRQSGPIVIRGGQLVMDHSTMSATVGLNSAGAQFLNGHITVQVTDTIRTNESQIVSNGGGLSPHGDVTLEAGKTIQLTNSRVESDAAFGDPGSNRGIVTLNAPLVNLDAAHVSATGHTVCCASSGAGSIAIQADRFNMKNGSELNVTGFAPTPSTPVGTIVINATDTVRIDQSQIAANGVPLSAAGNISISAGEIVSITNRSALAANGDNAGNIVIDAGKTVLIQGQSILRAESSSGGTTSGVHGGNILVQTPGQIRIDEGLVTTRAGGSAGGGNISLQSGDSVQLVHGTELTADHVGIGNAGRIDVQAGVNLVVEGGRLTADVTRGQAGLITLSAGDSLRLVNGTLVSANNTGTGSAGKIVLDAGGNVLLDASRLSTNSHVGQAGDIRVSAGDSVRLRNGTLLTASDNTGITGNAGRIVLDAGGNVVVDASQILAEPIAGQPGQIQLTAGDAVRVVNGSRLSVNNNGVGPAGILTIQAGTSVVGENSTFVAQTGEGHGGTIAISAPDQVRLTNSGVSAGVGGSPASVGGTIAITSETVRLENGRVTSGASNGTGGSITIKTNDFRPDAASVVDVSGGVADGTFSIQPLP